jgi:hypothetical protein
MLTIQNPVLVVGTEVVVQLHALNATVQVLSNY